MSSRRFSPLANPVLAACALLCASLNAASAQEVALPPVTIIGGAPLPGLEVPRDRVPAPVQTATDADLDRSQSLDLSSFMNRRLGSVYVNEIQNNPLQPDINYRGFTASPLLGTQQGLSVYLDGVRLNQPFGDVVSWDLVPKVAIGSMTLMPGSNPLYGLNTLGGAVAVQTKDGFSHPGSSVEVTFGSYQRRTLTLETGGHLDSGLHWYVAGSKLLEDGWRDDSPSNAGQLFGKVGWRDGPNDVALTASVARTALNGNGLQEARLLANDWGSVYTKPDRTNNKSMLLNLTAKHTYSDTLSITGQAYYRRIKTTTYNGDLNDDSLDQALYQPNAAERAALAGAGYTGYPTAGESAANTPFPKWRCIAQALLLDEPAEKCNGVINQTRTDQSQVGTAFQLNLGQPLFGLKQQGVVGVAFDAARSRFVQGSELGYLNADRSITGVGAFGDGINGGDEDGEPYDTRVDLSGRTYTGSLYGSSVLSLGARTHLTLSGRYNRVSVHNRDAILPGGGGGSLDGDHRFSRFNPAIGLTFAPAAGLSAYAGVNQGSRAPSSIELGCADPENPCKLPNAMAGDPPLKQVVTTTFEAGLRGRSNGVQWNVGVFRSDNRDDLLFVADNTAGFGYFRNFGKTRRQGVEGGISTRLASRFTVGAQYTWLDATFRSAEVVNGASNSSNSEAQEGLPGVDGTINIRKGDRIPLVPRQILKLYTDWQVTPSWSVGLDMSAIGGSLARGNENGQHQPDGTYYLGSGRNPGYTVFNLTTEVQPTKGLRLFALVANLFDRRYTTGAMLGATGFNANGAFQARPFPVNSEGDRPLVHSTFYAPGAPRSVTVGLKYSFGAQ